MDTLPDARSKAAIKQLLLGDPLMVSPQDLDQNVVNTSQEHRQEMRANLYGKRTSYKPTKANLNEALSTSCTYADEILPPWQSTMKSVYLPKETGERRSEASNYKSDMINSHFVMGPTTECKDLMTSSTKKDFIDHHFTQVTSRHFKDSGFEVKYPLIAVDPECKIEREPREAPKLDPNRLKPISKSNPSRKPACSVSLGNDPNDWKSVTKESMTVHPIIRNNTKSDYELLEKGRSTVLDNPDLVIEPMKSEHKNEYQISANLDRSTLTFDNTVSKKALNCTHFSFGNDSTPRTKSEYVLSYTPLNQARVRPIGAQNSDKSTIIVRDYDNEFFSATSHQLDYQPPPRTEMVKSKFKEINSKTSIELGSNCQYALARSLTANDYKTPDPKSYVHEADRHNFGRKKSRASTTFDSFNESDDKLPSISVKQADYRGQMDFSPTKDSVNQCRKTKSDFRSSHFSFECGGLNENPYISSTKSDFVVPKSEEMNAAGAFKSGTVSRHDNSFAVTVNKTITRYPYEIKNFASTTAKSYTGVTAPKREAIRPLKAQLENYIHPYKCISDQDGHEHFEQKRELSTVSRRTFVAPEVMKYKC